MSTRTRKTDERRHAHIDDGFQSMSVINLFNLVFKISHLLCHTEIVRLQKRDITVNSKLAQWRTCVCICKSMCGLDSQIFISSFSHFWILIDPSNCLFQVQTEYISVNAKLSCSKQITFIINAQKSSHHGSLSAVESRVDLEALYIGEMNCI